MAPKVLTLGVCALAFFLGNSCRPLAGRPVSAAVLSLKGDAEVISKGEKQIRLTTQSQIAAGANLNVSSGVRVDLMSLPGILVELEGETEAEVGALHFSKDGDDGSAATNRLRKASATSSRTI